MPYCTQADIETLYGADELRFALNLSGNAVLGAPELARVAAAIANADSLIDGYIAKNYTLPLPLIPPVLKNFAIDITIYTLAARQGRPRDELRKRYEDAISFLKSVAKGDAELPGIGGASATPAAEAEDGSSSGVQFVSRDRTFGRNTKLMT